MRTQNWIIAVLIIAVMAVGIADMAVAAKKKAKGQDLYKEFCSPCHGEDAEAGEYTPMTLIQDQWATFFDDKFVKSHQDVLDPNHDNQPVTEVISEEDLEKIKQWAIDHAADSEHPMTCG